MIKTLLIKNQINIKVGWAVVWLVAFGVGCVVEGACGTRGGEGTTRAGKGSFVRFALYLMKQLHAVAAFLLTFFRCSNYSHLLY